jgi:hypothetical protein
MGAALPKLKIDGGDFERNTEDCLDLNALLHPAQAFSHPADVVNDPDIRTESSPTSRPERNPSNRISSAGRNDATSAGSGSSRDRT